MTSQDQWEELESIQAIYDGSAEVVLQLPSSPVQPDDEDQPDRQQEDRGGDSATGNNSEEPPLRARITVETGSKRGLVAQLRAWLPPGYLAAEAAPPRFELASAGLSLGALSRLCRQLDDLHEEQPGLPVLYSWLEWLRLETMTFLYEAQEGIAGDGSAEALDPRAQTLEEQEEDEDVEDEEDPQMCANCCSTSTDGNSMLELETCGHTLCARCVSTTLQVYEACAEVPCCPLPCCRSPLPESTERPDAIHKPWMQVAKEILGTPFQESLVFCPRCEDLGLDIPVLLAGICLEEASSKDDCKSICWRCRWTFCGICRSPWHPGQDCFAEKHQVVRMSKRRPPLPEALREAASKVALEEEEAQNGKSDELYTVLEKASKQSNFEQVRKAFLEAFGHSIKDGLSRVLDSNSLALTPTPLGRELQSAFMRALLNNKGVELRPAFHGTDPKNYDSVFKRGLLIPGEGNELRIVHGAAHGTGIYTANIDAAWLSWGFCTGRTILVCAVIHSNVVRHVGDAMIVGRAENVVPLYEGTDTSLNYVSPYAHNIGAAAAVPTQSSAKVSTAAGKKAAAGMKDAAARDKGPKTKEEKVTAKSDKFKARLASQSNRR